MAFCPTYFLSSDTAVNIAEKRKAMEFRKVELWISSAIYVFVVYMNLLSTYEPTASYINHHLLPGLSSITIVYLSFLGINNIILPKYLPGQKWENICLAGLAAVFMMTVVFTVSHHYFHFDQQLSLQESFLHILPSVLLTVVLFFVYNILKRLVINLRAGSPKTIIQRSFPTFVVTFLVWLTVLLLFMVTNNRHFGPLWVSVVPFAYFIYLINLYWLLPEYERTHKNGLIYGVKACIAVVMVWMFFFLIWSEMLPAVTLESYMAASFLLLMISGLLSWFSHKQDLDQWQLSVLQRELGKSSADLSFLRSQINPHFLFNILNTLYGTAMQEKAARTSEGIQKLGDMMRFMLYQNTLDFIPLEREVTYLRDYIHLQQLRIAGPDQINVQVSLPQNTGNDVIAPMLLIPFVENAFKHGISLKHRSWIHISLSCENGKLDFDVYNSLNAKQGNDPEADASGIGLENVRQRMELLYPGKYQLNIRESKTEYFVHMTINLQPE